ncbi:chorismate--pyruvate lyase family protein [Psychrobacter sp. FDAARGOS_221]|uniref:chorismate--pyruvate lyase family protein n=1 Tax=Psychrobacter sp. FDAARGOS_221 TaxID=1975705 RepID=UPI000BB59BE1|nr:chorismate lyase [Psychrobacter sp. FDAARGOS_221]PNK61899.1 chorismate lyase [Psychrobacter sp. FDAARGOS_221]
MPSHTNTALPVAGMYSRIEDLIAFDQASLESALLQHIVDWLTSNGSLTALLEQKAGRPLRVERTFEGYRRLTLAQKKQMGYQGASLNRPMMAWIREVYLYGNSTQPWIAAQSLFPLPSLQGNAKRLQHLRGTPIGYVLFKRQNRLPNVRYFQKTVASASGDKVENNQQSSTSWSRHTVYDWYRRPLLISETFLPEFFASFSNPNQLPESK